MILRKVYTFMLGVAMCWTTSCNNAEQLQGGADNTEASNTETHSGQAPKHNTLSVEEKATGWMLLFDGNSVEHWKGAFNENDSFPEKGWFIEDGNLVVAESGGGESKNGGDIVTRELFGDFEFQVEVKLTPGANSGIKYYVDPAQTPNPGSALGLEFQILDDDLHPDAKMGRDGNRTIGSLYDLITADSSKQPAPIGEWNHCRIVAKNNHIEHWLNGQKVVEYERGGDAYQELVAQSKYKKYDNFAMVRKGHILLQDHGNRVAFRNLKVRRL